MFEQKSTSLNISSPEVSNTLPVRPQKRISEKKTSRTVDEIYEPLVGRIKAQYGNEITKQETHEAARNLLGLCNKIVEMEMERTK